MNSDSNERSDETLQPALLEAFRMLPSERCSPTPETDAAIMTSARETLTFVRRRRLHRRVWPALAAAACIAFALILFPRPPAVSTVRTTANTEDPYALILREVSAVFPKQIKAIVANGPDLQITLTEEPHSNNDQAVVLEVCEQGACTTVITYVGQTVEIGGHQFSILTDASGEIVIDSSDFFDPEKSPRPSSSGLQIKTRRI